MIGRGNMKGKENENVDALLRHVNFHKRKRKRGGRKGERDIIERNKNGKVKNEIITFVVVCFFVV